MHSLSRALLLVAAVGATAAAQQPLGATRPEPSLAARARAALDSALVADLLAQRVRWQQEEMRVHGILRHPQALEPGAQRVSMLHCHTDRLFIPVAPPRSARSGADDPVPPRPYPVPTLIASAAYKTAMCPNWLPLASLDVTSTLLDHQANGSAPARLTPFDIQLVERFEAAWAAFPEEPWFLRQLVRMATENGTPEVADRALARCPAAHRSLCAMLQAYTRYTTGDWRSAERAFRAALAAMPPGDRCVWQSAALLLAPADAALYRAMPCAERDVHDTRLWWLAMPFFAEEINLRHVEHLARQVRLRLVQELPLDAHHALRPEVGGDAIAEMRARYGWPQHLFWAGAEEDKAHTHYQGADNAPPFPAAEYWRSNSPTLPSWRAARDPLSLTDDDYAPELPAEVTHTSWWPREFFLHPRGAVARLTHTQAVVLRRDAGALVVVASELSGGQLEGTDAAVGRAFLMHSSSPGAAREVAEQAGTRGHRVLLHGLVRDTGVVSLEFLLNGGRVAGARSRFGVRGDLLRPLAEGACAVSPPMLLDPSAIRRRGIVDIEEGLLGRVQLVKPARLGVAWESYGFRDRDTVAVAIRISGVATQSALQRAGRFFGLGDDPRVGLTISWREPNPAHVVMALEGSTPTLLREIALDIGQLRAGRYELAVTMERRGCTPATSARAFSIVR